MLSPALDSLSRQLAAVLSSWTSSIRPMGQVALVREAEQDAIALFKQTTSGRPATIDAYQAILRFMRGVALDDELTHLLAGALAVRMKDFDRRSILGHPRLPELLGAYEKDARTGELWILTWFGLLCSYFEFNPEAAHQEESKGWESLREFLRQTWPLIDREAGRGIVPDWVSVVRSDPELLGENPAHRYALDYLRGEQHQFKRLSQDLAIPESSWFWHALVLSAVKRSAEQPDERFRADIPKMLELVERRPVFRDDALVTLLTRYHECAQPIRHEQLRDYVVRSDVWRNPKLRSAGLATTWNRVSDAVWRMVLTWVNEANLRDFFAILAGRRNADEGRLEFWSQYLDQIVWTRLIFCSETQELARNHEGIRNLIAREEGSYASIGAHDVDAFMMQIGGYVFIEFSKQPNAAYAYKADALPFEPYAPSYSGTTEDLKFGFTGERHRAARIVHRPGWTDGAGQELRRLGINPDVEVGKRQTSGRASDLERHRREAASRLASTNGTVTQLPSVDTALLQNILRRYPGAEMRDRRNGVGGRLWVEDPYQRPDLSAELKRLGFEWAQSKSAWYLRES